ncbi:MAG: outer membrane beta-barrel protein [Pseudomonadota bacterium]
MKFTKKTGLLSAIALTVMTSQVAFADDYTLNEGWYLGGNIGQSRAELTEAKMTNDQLSAGFSSGSPRNNNTIDRGYKLFGGYQFNQSFALEGGYFNLGEFDYTNNVLPNGAGTFHGNFKVEGINLDLVGYLPLSDKLTAFGRVGINHAETRSTFSGTGFVIPEKSSTSDRENNPKIGVGLEYAFNEALSMRVEAERYRVNDTGSHKADIDLFSVGLVYRFGAAPAPTPVVVVAPTPAPAPAPVPVEPPAPVFEKYTLSATELFGFDSSAVNLPQAKLEQIATALKTPGSPKQVVITGYTDRLGSDTYNQKLSEERALAVKAYMVNRGIDTDRLVAEGKGEADPVVVCNDKNKAALIECLKPNRRVEIDQVKLIRKISE